MFDFLIRKTVFDLAQKKIQKLKPAVQIHIHPEAPLPSISLVKTYAARVSAINALEPTISALSDDQLRQKTDEFKRTIQQGVQTLNQDVENLKEQHRLAQSQEERENISLKLTDAEKLLFKAKQEILDRILNEAFAVVREAGKRVRSMRHFDVQMVGGMVLHFGGIAEMTTGEGKTLVATLPAYLNALTGDGVHIVTVNDYLASRDRDWMGPIHESLGLTVGCIRHDMRSSERQKAYGCDITYGTNNEFGFDYLRDNMVSERIEMVQRPHAFAIVDEVDSILIDEARTPLIISGPAQESTDKYYRAQQIVVQLKGRRITEAEEIDAKHKQVDLGQGYDYLAEEKNKSISLTEEGERKGAELFGVPHLHDIDTVEYRHHLIQALRAKEFFVHDVDYVVKEGKVVIVDEFTGRMMSGRRWSDGLHQAVEAKEGIKIERENQTLATVTFQNYFRMYKKLSGMTGTAYTEANEFKQIYNLDTIVIPTNKPMARINHPDCIYKSPKDKYQAVVEEILVANKKGQPVLVGTISIEKSEVLSRLLLNHGIQHKVLNAKFHEMEAHIIAQAGRLGAVTIATNMAGRGTDIVLGGNAEYLARQLTQERGKNVSETDLVEMYQKFLTQFKEQCRQEHDKVIEAGGLLVIGTERHESRRIDNQLRGRCGRQGDPGAARFYVSLQDDLMRLFASDRIMFVMDKLGMKDGEVIESSMVSGALEVAQKRVENYNFEIRKHLLEYDNVMNKQREVIYTLRRSILDGENLKDVVLDGIAQTVHHVVDQTMTSSDNPEQALNVLSTILFDRFALDIKNILDHLQTLSIAQLKDDLVELLLKAYDEKEKLISPEVMRRMERILLLHVIDNKWKDHLHVMDHMKEGIGLRALGQRDPLVEYKKEAFLLFKNMYMSINEDIASMMYRLQPPSQENQPRSVFADLPQEAIHQEFQQPSQKDMNPNRDGIGVEEESLQRPEAKPIISSDKVGRNDLCPCGSGKKFKKCHGV